MVDTSVMADDTQNGVSDEVRAVGDGGVDVACMTKSDESGPHPAARDLGDAETTLMVKEMVDEHGISVELVGVRWWSVRDDGPISGLDQRFTAEVVVGVLALVFHQHP